MSALPEPHDDVMIMTEGLCYLTACAPGTLDGPQVEREVRRQRISGTSRGWLLSEDPLFADKIHTNPCACNQVPGRTHWLFAC